MNRILASYEIESPVGVEKAAAIIAGEQSTGTFIKLANETDEIRQRNAASQRFLVSAQAANMSAG